MDYADLESHNYVDSDGQTWIRILTAVYRHKITEYIILNAIEEGRLRYKEVSMKCSIRPVAVLNESDLVEFLKNIVPLSPYDLVREDLRHK
jgi:hypothetical protein